MIDRDLIERLKKATGPDRALDLTISVAVNFKGVFDPAYEWKWGAGGDEIKGYQGGKRRACLDPVQFVPHWTGSIAAALPGEKIVGMVDLAGRYVVIAEAPDGSQHEGRSSANEAIARRIAALEARAAVKERA